MTTKVSVDEFLSKRSAEVGKTETGRDAVFKGFAAPPSFDAEARKARFIVSSERIDRDGDIVVQKGIDLTAFEQNPQALLFHNSRGWPVGRWTDMAKKLRATPKHTEGDLNFAPAGGPIPEVDQAHWAVEHGLIRTVSIGFMPLDIEMIEHKDGESPWPYGFLINASELYEISLVPVPAQSDAVAKDLLAQGEARPAREFIEQALDDWARDPRTKMLVPKKELESLYQRYFGKQASLVLAHDLVAGPDASILRDTEARVAQACEAKGIKQPVLIPGEPISGPGIEAISGIAINISIAQGDPGSNTRLGTEVGDQGTPAADASIAAQGAVQRDQEIPELPRADEARKPSEASVSLLQRAKSALKRFFGEDAAPTPEPKLLPGAYKAREQRISSALDRLRAMS